MKKSIVVVATVAAAALLSGCVVSVPPQPGTPKTHAGALPPFQMAPSHENDVQAIATQAKILGQQILNQQITKVQAAQYLNKFRIATVGNNPIDDVAYAAYLENTVKSQQGRITSEKSKSSIMATLSKLTDQWNASPIKPTDNPAFTNFLLQTMGMPLLR